MEITFKGNEYEASTPYGVLTGCVDMEGGVSINTPYVDGKDTYITINGIEYRFRFWYRKDGGSTGLNLIYRKGHYLSGSKVTANASGKIYKIAREVFHSVKASQGYAEAIKISDKDNKFREIARMETELKELKEKIEKLYAEL
jgi:hypothetical protein